MNGNFVYYTEELCQDFGADKATICSKVWFFCGDKNTPAPIQLTWLVSLLKLKDDRTLKKYIKELVQDGMIEYKPRFGKGLSPLFKRGQNLYPYYEEKGAKNALKRVQEMHPKKYNKNINNIIEEKNIIKKDVLNVMKKFIKPTAEEVRAYCEERGNGIEAEQFIDFYEQKGWMVGRNHMKDWRAAVRTWEHRNKQEKQQKQNNYGKRNTSTPADAAAAAAVGIALADAERAAEGY